MRHGYSLRRRTTDERGWDSVGTDFFLSVCGSKSPGFMAGQIRQILMRKASAEISANRQFISVSVEAQEVKARRRPEERPEVAPGAFLLQRAETGRPEKGRVKV
jgi:hypothetical protein